MSQKAFLAAFDAGATSAFAAAGMADAAVYSPPGSGAVLLCLVLVDRAVESFGDDPMPVAVYDVAITFQRAEVVPERGGQLVVDGEVYRLTDKLLDDGSAIRWAVSRV